MKRIILYLIIIAFISVNICKGQISQDSIPLMLEKLFVNLANGSDDNRHLQTNDSIKSIIDSYVLSDSVFNHRFTNFRYLGQITSPDSLMKIITWNLVFRSGKGMYFSYFIRKQEQGNRIYRLITAYKEEPIMTDTVYTESNWYGALYYDIKPYQVDSTQCWVILGIDFGNLLITRKIIDVLTFTQDDSIIFGRKWFDSGKGIKFRDVFEYASDGMMSLRFRSDNSIVFDHLVPFSPEMTGNHQYYGPDYSYDSYDFENGFWKLRISVDAKNKE